MRIQLIAVGTRMPDWVDRGYQNYARRLPAGCALHLTEIAAEKRSKSAAVARLVAAEGRRMLDALRSDQHVIALDVGGEQWSTEQLAGHLDGWMHSGRDVALLVGGADGLAPACLARAASRWSLSRLTLPHALVRVVLAEQVYRAWTLLSGHPYHRG